jgi:hypothetical protein
MKFVGRSGKHPRSAVQRLPIALEIPLLDLQCRARKSGSTADASRGLVKRETLDSVPDYRVYTWLVMQQVRTKPLTIGRLAQEAGINLETVRYYEPRITAEAATHGIWLSHVPARSCAPPQIH